MPRSALFQLQTICLRRALMAAWLALAMLCSGAAQALDRSMPVADYQHTVWTARDGAPAHIFDMIQTSDGWILVVTSSGLFRFDGVRFEPYRLPGQALPGRSHLSNIFPGPDGELWLNYAVAGGFTIVHADGTLEDIAPLAVRFPKVRRFALAPDGTRWAATERGVRWMQGKEEFTPGPETGLPTEDTWGILFEPDGTLWVATIHGVYRRPAGTMQFERRADTHGPANLIRSPGGQIWLAPLTEDRVTLLSGSARAPAQQDATQSSPTSLFDRDGNLWTVACPQRLCRTPAGAVQGATVLHPAADQPGPAAPQPTLIMEDRAGSIWVATEYTVERIRDSRAVPVHFPGDLGISLARDPAGRVHAADDSVDKNWILTPGGARPDPEHPVHIISNSPSGAYVAGGRRTILRQTSDRTEQIALPPGPDGKPADLDVMGLTDDGHAIWMFARETGLMAYVDGQWYPRTRFHLPKSIMHSVPVGAGKIWFAGSDGGMSLYDHDRLTTFDGKLIGTATYLDAGAPLVICGEYGMAVLQGKSFIRLTAFDPRVLLNVSGIAVSRNGDRWLNGGAGVVHVRAADWQASLAHPATPLRYELIDEADGYRGHAFIDNRQRSAVADKDDQLWFATTDGVMRIDANQPARPASAPRADITGLSSDGAAMALARGLVLPALPHNVNISYAAPGAAKPEDVRYQYRLSGEETAWQNAGLRRTAFYTSLAPGPHRFEVRAIDASGAWQGTPATLDFAVTPTLLQTVWFRALLGAMAAALLYLLYRWRMHALAAQFQGRLHERLDERNRIARELHDTLLQSVQGVLLTVHGAALRLPESDVRRMLDDAVDQAERAIGEARARVRDLRGDDHGMSLSELFAALGKELAGADGPRFAVRVEGAARTLRAEVAREAFAIGREALLNAFHHAQASTIGVTLAYGSVALALRIEDDGCGIGKEVTAAGGRPGHWGMDGMRERTEAQGGQFTLASAPGAGTRIVVEIPAARVYA